MDITKLSLSEQRDLLAQRKLSVKELVSTYIDKIKKEDSKINSFVNVNEDVIKQAEEKDNNFDKLFEKEELFGVPLGVKDMFCTEGIKTTAASKALESFIPPYSSSTVLNLQNSGALILGKCNQDEFAMGSSNENSLFGVCKNPHNLEYVPGGSSGGSAAAVAAGFSPATLGTDTGGSIRQPASFCGVVGVKPTYGRVSRYGIIAFASSLDQAGPFAKTVKDAALLTEVMSGHDPYDGTSLKLEVPSWSKNINSDIKGKKIAIVKECFDSDIDEDVLSSFEECKSKLEALGATVSEVSLPLIKTSVAIYYIIATSEASSNLSRYDGVRFGYRKDFSEKAASSLEEFYSLTRGEAFGEEVKRRIILGTHTLSSGYYDAYYNKACQVRRLLRDSYFEVFKEYDAIISPVATTAAFKIGERISNPLEMYLNDIYTTSVNLAGLPGISVPVGYDKNKMPIGFQIITNQLDEQTMFDIASALENEIQFDGGVQ